MSVSRVWVGVALAMDGELSVECNIDHQEIGLLVMAATEEYDLVNGTLGEQVPTFPPPRVDRARPRLPLHCQALGLIEYY